MSTSDTIAPVTDGSDLVATPKRGALTGAEPLTDLQHFGDDIAAYLAGDGSPLDTTVDELAIGLDFLGAYVDPLGTAIAAGVGWIIEHVSFLREPFDALTGDPQAIDAVAETWRQVGERMKQTGEQYEISLRDVASWQGEAAEHYRGAAEQYVIALRGVASHCENVAWGVTAGGLLSASGRAVVLNLISKFLEEAIIEALGALASSWCTFGASLAVAATAIEIEATFTATDCEIKITIVVDRAGEIGIRMVELGEKAAKAAAKLRKLHARTHALEESTALGKLHHQDDQPLGRTTRQLGERTKELDNGEPTGSGDPPP